jgi:hypothetical protein
MRIAGAARRFTILRRKMADLASTVALWASSVAEAAMEDKMADRSQGSAKRFTLLRQEAPWLRRVPRSASLYCSIQRPVHAM